LAIPGKKKEIEVEIAADALKRGPNDRSGFLRRESKRRLKALLSVVPGEKTDESRRGNGNQAKVLVSEEAGACIGKARETPRAGIPGSVKPSGQIPLAGTGKRSVTAKQRRPKKEQKGKTEVHGGTTNRRERPL